MALVDIKTAILTDNVTLGDKIVVKTLRDGYSGIYNQHTFGIVKKGEDVLIVEDGLPDALPAVIIQATNVLAVSNTKVDRYNPAIIHVITGAADKLNQVALSAFNNFAHDEFSFPEYNVCVSEILVDVIPATPPTEGGGA